MAVTDTFAWLEEQQKEWEEPLSDVFAEARSAASAARVLWEDRDEAAKGALEQLHQRCWRQLHDEKSVAQRLWPWREVFAVCCFMRSRLEEKLQALRLLDLGLILGGPETKIAPSLHERAEALAQELWELSSRKRSREEGPGDAGGWLATTERSRLPRPAAPVPEVLGFLSMEKFLLGHFSTKSPVAMRQGCAGWPAVHRWRKESFWSGRLGQRFVPVETDYWMDEGFNIMQLKDFIQHCKVAGACSNPSKGGYLAQHALFDQLPSLEADLTMPDLALCGSGGTVLRQVFFGPEGTVTPLHSDPYENIFCQVVGVKYLRLYAPSESHRLYPRQGEMKNNSRLEPVDLLLGDVATYQEKFPDFLEAEFQDVVLHPGDVLYLPMGWWHFVKSFDGISISVAFHFT